jgi:CheY-like chemotaxis protein
MSAQRNWTRREAQSPTVTPHDETRASRPLGAIVPQGDRFLALLSHELRTPLTPILAIVSALENTNDVPKSFREMLGRIRRNVEIESRLIDDLIDMGRIQQRRLELRLSLLELDALVLDVARRHQQELRERGLELRVSLKASRCLVMADRARLEQVAGSLLSNAIKFTPAGGTIRVDSWNPGPDVVAVAVSDDGIGIDPDRVDAMFEPFEQAHAPGERFGGLGLGLAMARGLVEVHGGRIWGRSAGPSCGAQFGFELPVGARRPATDPDADGREGARALTILLVEDHVDSAQTIAELLESGGHRTVIANDMASALELAREPFDVLISDIGLPDGSGVELVRRLSERGPVHGIALSGFSSDLDVEQSLRAGFSEYLTKPVGTEQLLDAVERVAAFDVTRSGVMRRRRSRDQATGSPGRGSNR